MTAAKGPAETAGGARMRLAGLIRKEFLQVLRDPSSIAIAFLMPLLLLLLFGYGVSLDAEHVPVAIVAEQPNADTEAFAGAFRQSRYFAPVIVPGMKEAVALMNSHRVDAIVRLKENISRRMRSEDGAPIQLIVNGIDANNARLVQGYVEGVWAKWLQAEALAAGREPYVPVQIEERVWFNSDLKSRNFVVPGLIAIIMTLIGALLTAMVMAREWERGTMEALMVTPVTIREVIAGKLIPYYILGMGGMALSVLMATGLFGVPLKGSLWVLFLASSLFLLTALGMGMLISVAARNQFVAGQAAIIVTFLPAFILSGFLFDISSMPKPVQVITHIVAARYFIAILQTIFLAGNIWAIILPNAAALLLMAGFFLGLARKRTRKSLE